LFFKTILQLNFKILKKHGLKKEKVSSFSLLTVIITNKTGSEFPVSSYFGISIVLTFLKKVKKGRRNENHSQSVHKVPLPVDIEVKSVWKDQYFELQKEIVPKESHEC
jgi:hypothetical protein